MLNWKAKTELSAQVNQSMFPATTLYEEEKWKYQNFQSFLPHSQFIHWTRKGFFFPFFVLSANWTFQSGKDISMQMSCLMPSLFVGKTKEQLGKSSPESSLGAAWPGGAIVIAHFDKSYCYHTPCMTTTFANICTYIQYNIHTTDICII